MIDLIKFALHLAVAREDHHCCCSTAAISSNLNRQRELTCTNHRPAAMGRPSAGRPPDEGPLNLGQAADSSAAASFFACVNQSLRVRQFGWQRPRLRFIGKQNRQEIACSRRWVDPNSFVFSSSVRLPRISSTELNIWGRKFADSKKSAPVIYVNLCAIIASLTSALEQNRIE